MSDTRGTNGEDASAAKKVDVFNNLPLSPVAGCSSAFDTTSVEDMIRDRRNLKKENENKPIGVDGMLVDSASASCTVASPLLSMNMYEYNNSRNVSHTKVRSPRRRLFKTVRSSWLWLPRPFEGTSGVDEELREGSRDRADSESSSSSLIAIDPFVCRSGVATPRDAY